MQHYQPLALLRFQHLPCAFNQTHFFRPIVEPGVMTSPAALDKIQEALCSPQSWRPTSSGTSCKPIFPDIYNQTFSRYGIYTSSHWGQKQDIASGVAVSEPCFSLFVNPDNLFTKEFQLLLGYGTKYAHSAFF
jgi:hypothetical protein